ncbi:hypothetical protein PybrP1_003689 [[Pythium] brassicae (nom. inval.)]|nr:hypothetical protein PybrP1_003689 [[Pythium] brassicae (nom. inval.)]
MVNVKPVVKTSTMEQELQDEVIAVAQHAMDTEVDEQQIAATIKTHFEQKHHGMLWHCCVGRNVACYVTHEQSKFLYFYIGQMAVVLFATAGEELFLASATQSAVVGSSAAPEATASSSPPPLDSAARAKLTRQRSRTATSTSPPPPLPLISLPPDDEFEEFNTPTRSGFHYELPYVDLPLEEFEDTSGLSSSYDSDSESSSSAGGASGAAAAGRRRRDSFPLAPDPDRVKNCRLLSAYMTQNELYQTQRHGFGIDTRLVYKRNKGSDVPVPAAAATAAGSADDVSFNALFESGNLDRAYRVNGRHYASTSELLGVAAAQSASPSTAQPPFAFFVRADLEYDLYCDVDVNTHGHVQWYFFRAALPGGRTTVRFNLRNMLKRASLYNDGMLPAVYIDGPAAARRGWHHAGTNVCYFKNADTYRNRKTGKVQNFYTLSFVYEFDTGSSAGGSTTGTDTGTTGTTGVPATVVYFAHCYPYPYTRLQRFLLALQRDAERSQHLKRRVLCKTIAGNHCELLTITDFAQEDGVEQPYGAKRAGVFLTARVHPGESNSSFVMHGIVDFLTGDSREARFLRHHFVFKLVPMLNPDGVVHGNYRCSLAGTDLNRRWARPSAELHPTILAAKTALLSMQATRPLQLYCDLHGHSRKKNVFLYGCRPLAPGAAPRAEAARLRLFPHLLAKVSSAQRGGFYSYADCTFSVSSAKKGTGRVVVWREAAVLHSFTLEASFFGVGPNKQQPHPPLDQLAGATGLRHFTAFDLRAVGAKFCAALVPFAQVVNLDRVEPTAGRRPDDTQRLPPPEASPTARSPRSPATNKLLLAPLHRSAGAPSSQRPDGDGPLPLLSPNQLERRPPTPRQFCEPQAAPPLEAAAALGCAPTPTPLSSVPSGFPPSDFDALFAGDEMAALLSLADPQDLLKEIEAALPEDFADCGDEDGSVGSESDPSGDNMEDEELQSAPSWRTILPLPAESPAAEPAARLRRARPLRLMRHLSEPRLRRSLSLKKAPEPVAEVVRVEPKAEPQPSVAVAAAPLAPVRAPPKAPVRVASLRSLPNDRNRDIAALHLRAVQRRSKTRRELQQPLCEVVEY